MNAFMKSMRFWCVFVFLCVFFCYVLSFCVKHLSATLHFGFNGTLLQSIQTMLQFWFLWCWLSILEGVIKLGPQMLNRRSSLRRRSRNCPVTYFNLFGSKSYLFLKLTNCTWKWMVGIRSFPFGVSAYFQVQSASFRKGSGKRRL